MGCFPTKDMQTTHLRSGHLDIKDAQCAETKDVLKKSYCVFELWRPKGPKRCAKS